MKGWQENRSQQEWRWWNSGKSWLRVKRFPANWKLLWLADERNPISKKSAAKLDDRLNFTPEMTLEEVGKRLQGIKI